MTRFASGFGRWRSAALLTAAACAVAASGACLAPMPEHAHPDSHSVRVEPRVVMDGLVELGQRADHRIVVDEVVFHAPEVVQRRGDSQRDVLATDPAGRDPLLFRYHIASADGFGDVLGGARSWVLNADETNETNDAELEFRFSPFALEGSALMRLEDAAGVELSGLLGHTAFVHGYVTMSAQGAGFSAGSDSNCDGDPDGNPADCTRADGDPDGNPADPQPDNDGDPDGNPAKPRATGRVDAASDGDPDGNPAKPEGAHQLGDDHDGDPDGNPAKPRGRGFAKGELAITETPFDHDAVTASRVPFVLLLNAAFALEVPVAELLEVDVDNDEVLPIDLHLSLAELFSIEQIEMLEQRAATQQRGAVMVELADAGAIGIDVRSAGVRRASEAVSGGGIRVTGDLR